MLVHGHADSSSVRSDRPACPWGRGCGRLPLPPRRQVIHSFQPTVILVKWRGLFVPGLRDASLALMAVAILLPTVSSARSIVFIFHGNPPIFMADIDVLTEAGHSIFREGAIFAELVYRFKGPSAQAAIFAEIDFEALDERQLGKLFVGMTRARLKRVLVISELAAGVLLEPI